MTALGRGRGRINLEGLPLLCSRVPPRWSHHAKMEQELRQRRKQEEMDWKGTRRAVLIAGEGQPPASTITGNHDTICMQGLVQLARSPRRCGEAETPTSHQPPHGAQGRRLLGPAALRPCPFASRHGQVQARLGPGGYCRRSGNGGPQTCLPAACGVAQRGPSTAHLHQHKTQDPREGPSLAGWTTRSFLRRGLIRLAHEEAERSRRGTSRGARDASHDDQGC